jgi:hypothetical protein
MRDNDLIRREDVAEILFDEGWYGDTMTRLDALPAVDVAGVRARVAAAIFDPGETEGYKGERTLTEWQVDAVMRALIDTPAAAPLAEIEGSDAA